MSRTTLSKSFVNSARDNASHFVLAGALLAAAGMAAVAPARADDAPIVLGPVKVEDQNSRNAQTRPLAPSRSPTSSVQDTPQAVTVIDSETIRQQATTTLGDALRNVPGITIAIGEGGTLAGDQFKIRGFDAKDDVYLDGLRDFAAYSRDSFNYQEVQVLKGPSGLMFGRGTTGGAINVVSKTPHLGNSYNMAAEIGNGDHYRGTADLNYELDDTAALRLNFMVTDTGVVDRDITHNSRWGIAPSVALGLGTDTTFTLSYIHQHTDAIPDYGLVVAQNGFGSFAVPVSELGVPRSNFLGFDTDRDRNDADIVTAKVTHVATPWLTLENDARVAAYSRYFQYTTVDRCDITDATNKCADVMHSAHPEDALGGIGGGGPYRQYSWGAQDIISGTAEFHVGGLRNLAIAGADVSYQSAHRTIFAYTLPSTSDFFYALNDHKPTRQNIGVSLFNPTHKPPPHYNVILPNMGNVVGTNATPTTVVDSLGEAVDLAAFATDRLWFNDQLSLIAGVRFDGYNSLFRTRLVNNDRVNSKAPSSLTNPRASLVYEPDENQTYYASWSRSSVPIGTSVVGAPTPLTNANQELAPEKSETFEIGAKVNLFDGGLGLSGSLFQVQKSNTTTTDPATGNINLQSGQKQRVQGFEASATGYLAEDWTVLASYTYLNPVITNDLLCTGTAPNITCVPNQFTIGKQIFFVPKHAISVWTDYKANDLLPGLSFGGGVLYQSRLYNAYGTGIDPDTKLLGLSRTVIIPETIELDAVAAYDVDALHFQLNVNNITDRLNYSQSFGNRGTPSPGRTFIFTVGWSLQ